MKETRSFIRICSEGKEKLGLGEEMKGGIK